MQICKLVFSDYPQKKDIISLKWYEILSFLEEFISEVYEIN